jgi:glycosyltransferase involved in cell wall biosynthesis
MLPRLLLVSEESLSQEGTGINRTLVNLLAGYPPEKFMLYTASSSQSTAPVFRQNVVTFSAEFLPALKNRIGTVINGAITLANLQLVDWLPLPHRHQIEAFAPEVILICPNSATALLMGHKIVKELNIPYLIYFMDDWVATNHSHWLSGSIQAYTQHLLNYANGWLMISNRLKIDLAKRYEVNPTQTLIVHSPVNLSNQSPPDFSLHQGTFQIAYAGSIWPMHYDAIATIAAATNELQQTGHKIELILYTSESFWNQYKLNWEQWNVTFGGFIAYEQLGRCLRQADLLLVASSFLPQNAHLTRSSVQTKLTDYMASGRPILACGPNYAACHDFVKQWNCGVVCETNDKTAVQELLLHCMQTKTQSQVFAKNAYQVLQDQFEMEQVRERLYQFIEKTLTQLSSNLR